MQHDVMEQLARREVPPAPAELDQGIHQRLNKMLLASHVADFALGALPYAVGQLARALVGLLVFTFSGETEFERRSGSRRRKR